MANRVRQRVVGYVRVSTAMQVESGLGLEDQAGRIRAYCEAAGLDLVEIIRDEGVSGGTPIADRPGGARVIESLGTKRRRQVDGVVALKLDRLFRDALDCLSTVRAWDAMGVALHVLDLGGCAIDTRSAVGRMMVLVLGGMAELERGLAGERTAAAMAELRRQGRYTGGRPPYGWRLDDQGDLAPDEAERQTQGVALGLQRDGLSLRRIGVALAGSGRLPRAGGAWAASQVRCLLRAAAGVQADPRVYSAGLLGVEAGP